MKRSARSVVSALGEQFLGVSEQRLRTHEDLTVVSIRNALSDLRHVVAWGEQKEERIFRPDGVATPTITRSRASLPRACHPHPASINRPLISLTCDVRWLIEEKSLSQNLAKGVKLLFQEEPLPHPFSDQEKQGLVAAVTSPRRIQDWTLIFLLSHTELRAREASPLRWDQVQKGKRSGLLQVVGKWNISREVPLNSTIRTVLLEDLAQVCEQHPSLFPSAKTRRALTKRVLGSMVTTYARLASASMCVPTTCVIALAIGWRRRPHSIASRTFWGMIPWTPPDALCKEQHRICTTQSRRWHGIKRRPHYGEEIGWPFGERHTTNTHNIALLVSYCRDWGFCWRAGSLHPTPAPSAYHH